MLCLTEKKKLFQFLPTNYFYCRKNGSIRMIAKSKFGKMRNTILCFFKHNFKKHKYMKLNKNYLANKPHQIFYIVTVAFMLGSLSQDNTFKETKDRGMMD